MSATTKNILVVNSKGGSGKTTIATNLAVAFANQGLKVSLLDCDRQASCLHWAEERSAQAPKITTAASYHSADKLTAQIGHQLGRRARVGQISRDYRYIRAMLTLQLPRQFR